jgi:hypothetical protein
MTHKHLLGKSVWFILKDRPDVMMKVMQETSVSIHGYDDESMNFSILKTNIEDYHVLGQ